MSDLDELRYLGRCAGFGFSPCELRQAQRDGYQKTVERLLQQPSNRSDIIDSTPFTTTIPPGFTGGAVQIVSLIVWWLQRLIKTEAPLAEKMVLFWHGFFTTSAEQVFSGSLLLEQHNVLRQNSLGSFNDLLREVSLGPAMLVYLDGAKNVATHPNENFARELMELFTIGIGHYSEKDVRQAAAALSGWQINWLSGKANFQPELHAEGPKRVLGQVIWTAEDLLRMLASHQGTAQNVVSRLFHFFTGCPIEAAEKQRLAQVFIEHHGQMAPVVKNLLLGSQFRRLAHQQSGRTPLGPIEWFVWMCRGLKLDFFQGLSWDVPGFDWRNFEAFRALGQVPFLPPSVQGWPAGAQWLNSASLRDRWLLANWATQQCSQKPLPDALVTDPLFALGLSLERDRSGGHSCDGLRASIARLRDPVQRLCLILCSPEAQVR